MPLYRVVMAKRIVPNSTSKSLIINRILSEKKSILMPPPETNLFLNNAKKAILISG